MILFDKNIKEQKTENIFFKCVYIFIFFLGIYSGIYAYRMGYLVKAKHHFQSLNYNPSKYLSFLLNNQENNFSEMNIDFKFKNYIKLSNQRSRFIFSFNHFIKGKQWHHKKEIYASCKLKHKESKYKAKAKLFGLNNDHYRHPHKWSFRIKTKDFIHEFRNNKFNLLQPNTRMFISDVLCNKVFESFGLFKLEYKPINLKINNFERDLYFLEDFFSKNLIEKNNRRESYIFTANKINSPSSTKLSVEAKKEIDEIKNVLLKSPNKIIDENAFNVLIALAFIAQNKHAILSDNLHFYYNPVSAKVEPIIREVWFEKALNVKTEQALKKQIKKFLQSNLKNVNTLLQNYFQQLSNNETQIKNLCATIKSVAIAMDTIINEPAWKNFEKAIFSRYPEGLYLCKNIYSNINQLKKISIAKEDPKITNDITIKENLILENDLIVKNQHLKIINGTDLDLNGNNIILENGSIQILGSAEKPATIYNTHKSPSSIIILKATDTSYFKNVVFKNLSNYNQTRWKLPSAITFYESNVVIDSVIFDTNIAGDDYLNLFRCNYFKIENSSFINVKADAIDSDFSNGEIINCKFINIGNDAIDGSGSKINISSSFFEKIQDKVFSAGELSNFKVKNSEIRNSEIVFVSKDGSILYEDNNSLKNNILEYCVYNKKEAFTNGTLYTNKDLKKFNYLLEKKSAIYIHNKLETDFIRVLNIKDKLYGKIYGKRSVR